MEEILNIEAVYEEDGIININGSHIIYPGESIEVYKNGVKFAKYTPKKDKKGIISLKMTGKEIDKDIVIMGE